MYRDPKVSILLAIEIMCLKSSKPAGDKLAGFSFVMRSSHPR